MCPTSETVLSPSFPLFLFISEQTICGGAIEVSSDEEETTMATAYWVPERLLERTGSLRDCLKNPTERSSLVPDGSTTGLSIKTC